MYQKSLKSVHAWQSYSKRWLTVYNSAMIVTTFNTKLDQQDIMLSFLVRTCTRATPERSDNAFNYNVQPKSHLMSDKMNTVDD